MPVNKPNDAYQLYAIVCAVMIGYIILTTFTGDYNIRRQARREMEKLRNTIPLLWAWIPETIYKIGAVYWRTSGQDYHGRHRAEDQGVLQT